MKRTLKGTEPISLQTYRQAQPNSNWDDLKDDPMHGGKPAYDDIRQQTHQDQGGLCAYCEIDIRCNDPLKSRVEHFHPKSDQSMPTNWALEWTNMLAVCAGGSYRYGSAPHTMEPLSLNLSCDAHKDQLIQQGKLHPSCEGWVIDPLELPVQPSLFKIDKFNGELHACDTSVTLANPWPGNQHADVATLVERTIERLNLNCVRLCTARLTVIRDIEKNKKKQRMAGKNASQGFTTLAQRYLRIRWPAFFTTICLCLGSSAENHLKQMNYQG
jgi:uncharacterized protein (TIGR02646 family)